MRIYDHPGRPSKLNPEVRERLVNAIRLGCPHEAAARAAGIGVSTFRSWMVRGERDRRAIYPHLYPDEPAPKASVALVPTRSEYLDLLEAVEQAEAFAEVRLVALWSAAAAKDWRAAAALLGARYPAKYARRSDGQQEVSDLDKQAPAFVLVFGGAKADHRPVAAAEAVGGDREPGPDGLARRGD
ncbi:MAG: hypothetical protein M3167_02470 [Acidobacteriota bacterium]|nr:hypothetical protein [Acidobacteriota bacterium]